MVTDVLMQVLVRPPHRVITRSGERGDAIIVDPAPRELLFSRTQRGARLHGVQAPLPGPSTDPYAPSYVVVGARPLHARVEVGLKRSSGRRQRRALVEPHVLLERSAVEPWRLWWYPGTLRTRTARGDADRSAGRRHCDEQHDRDRPQA